MEEQIKQLEERVKKLERTQNLTDFPIEFQHILEERLAPLTVVDTGTYTQSNIERTVALSGDPENITVLAYPDSYIRVRVKGGDIKFIPVFNNS